MMDNINERYYDFFPTKLYLLQYRLHYLPPTLS